MKGWFNPIWCRRAHYFVGSREGGPMTSLCKAHVIVRQCHIDQVVEDHDCGGDGSNPFVVDECKVCERRRTHGSSPASRPIVG